MATLKATRRCVKIASRRHVRLFFCPDNDHIQNFCSSRFIGGNIFEFEKKTRNDSSSEYLKKNNEIFFGVNYINLNDEIDKLTKGCRNCTKQINKQTNKQTRQCLSVVVVVVLRAFKSVGILLLIFFLFFFLTQASKHERPRRDRLVTTDGQLRCESLGKFGTGVGRSAAGRLFGRKICPRSKDAAATVQLDHQFVVGNIFIPHV
ncbi:hypothetical protein Tsp_12973 [Trichinella spiralis]|uniref:hypothetical protein n=1 Tax=Trichinella spiralis TaxID=6334 RepID=UPI0001EFD845|nr:hypothetical protein Tsp_12973 [Trichinella spiralis]